MSKSIEVLETIKNAALVDELQQSEDGVRVAVAMGLVKSATIGNPPPPPRPAPTIRQATTVQGTSADRQGNRAKMENLQKQKGLVFQKTSSLAKPKLVTTSPQVPAPAPQKKEFKAGRFRIGGK